MRDVIVLLSIMSCFRGTAAEVKKTTFEMDFESKSLRWFLKNIFSSVLDSSQLQMTSFNLKWLTSNFFFNKISLFLKYFNHREIFLNVIKSQNLRHKVWKSFFRDLKILRLPSHVALLLFLHFYSIQKYHNPLQINSFSQIASILTKILCVMFCFRHTIRNCSYPKYAVQKNILTFAKFVQF